MGLFGLSGAAGAPIGPCWWGGGKGFPQTAAIGCLLVGEGSLRPRKTKRLPEPGSLWCQSPATTPVSQWGTEVSVPVEKQSTSPGCTIFSQEGSQSIHCWYCFAHWVLLEILIRSGGGMGLPGLPFVARLVIRNAGSRSPSIWWGDVKNSAVTV